MTITCVIFYNFCGEAIPLEHDVGSDGFSANDISSSTEIIQQNLVHFAFQLERYSLGRCHPLRGRFPAPADLPPFVAQMDHRVLGELLRPHDDHHSAAWFQPRDAGFPPHERNIFLGVESNDPGVGGGEIVVVHGVVLIVHIIGDDLRGVLTGGCGG